MPGEFLIFLRGRGNVSVAVCSLARPLEKTHVDFLLVRTPLSITSQSWCYTDLLLMLAEINGLGRFSRRMDIFVS